MLRMARVAGRQCMAEQGESEANAPVLDALRVCGYDANRLGRWHSMRVEK